MELFIPARIGNDDKFAKGIGKTEMKRIVVFALVGLILGGIASVFLYTDFQSILIITILSGGVLSIVGYFFCKKNSINLSVYNYFQLMINFLRLQQFFIYKKRKEWI